MDVNIILMGGVEENFYVKVMEDLLLHILDLMHKFTLVNIGEYGQFRDLI